MHDAEPGDLYQAPDKELVLVTGMWPEKAVEVRPIWPEFGRQRMGGVGGLMWVGFERIARNVDPPSPDLIEKFRLQAAVALLEANGYAVAKVRRTERAPLSFDGEGVL